MFPQLYCFFKCKNKLHTKILTISELQKAREYTNANS